MRGFPTTVDLVEAVRQFLEDKVMTGADESIRFEARVAANVLAIVERELASSADGSAGPSGRHLDADHDARLSEQLAAGDLDDRLADVAAALRSQLVAQLRIGNPRYLLPSDAE